MVPIILLLVLIIPVAATAHNHTSPRCGFETAFGIPGVHTLPYGTILNTRPTTLPETAESADGSFRVHYIRSGPDAVPADDINHNGIPDFVDEALAALTYSREQYIAMGYRVPPGDGGAGGSDAIDVYMRDLSTAGPSGQGLYGLTSPDTRISQTTPPRFTSFIEVDNNFSADDRNSSGGIVYGTTGVNGLRVTCAHELYHVFQSGSYGVFQVQPMIYEFTATLMEQLLYPTIPDWVSYTSKLFTRPAEWPFGTSSGITGYVWGFWGQVVYNSPARNAILDIWNQIYNGTYPMQAFVNAIDANGTSLRDVFCNSLPLFYATGSRSVETDGLLFSADLPEIQLGIDAPAEPPSTMATGNLRAFEVRAFRYSLPNADGNGRVSAAIVVTWPDAEAFVRSNPNEQNPFTIIVTNSPLPSDIPIAGTTWGVRITPSNICAWVQGSATHHVEAPYPNPVRLSQSTIINIPVNAQSGENVEVTLLTSDFIGIATFRTTVILDDVRPVARIELSPTLQNGPYLLRIQTNSATTLTKCMILR